MALARVEPGAKREAEMVALLPTTIVTAIVSPSARPSPSIEAPKIPRVDPFNTARRVTYHRVAPSAKAASRCETGTERNTTREIDVMIGTIMIATIMAADKMHGP